MILFLSGEWSYVVPLGHLVNWLPFTHNDFELLYTREGIKVGHLKTKARGPSPKTKVSWPKSKNEDRRDVKDYNLHFHPSNVVGKV